MTGPVTAQGLLQAIGGYQEQTRQGDEAPPLTLRSVRLAVIDPTYDPTAAFPGPLVPPKVRFEGEEELGLKEYAVLNGYVPQANDRVLMVQIGTSWVVVGKVGNDLDVQGFWADAVSSGVELGGGAYYDSDEGLVIPDTDITRRGKLIIDNHKSYGATALGITSTSGQGDLYVNVGPSMSFTKLYGTETTLEIFIKLSARFTSGTVPGPGRVGVRINNTDHIVDHTVFQALNIHYPLVGIQRVPQLAAGTYVVQPRMRAIAATTTPVMAVDSNDYICMSVTEVEAT